MKGFAALRFSLIFSLAFVSVSIAQPYAYSVGLRVGSPNGVSIRSFMGEQAALNVTAAYRQEGLRAIALAEYHSEIGRSDTYFFIGGGAFAGYNRLFHAELTPQFTAGAAAEIGFEYVFPHSPLSVSIDWMPAYQLSGQRAFIGNTAGFTARLLID